MGIRLQRQKKRHLLASALYRLLKLPVSNEYKFRLFMDLEWIFNRLSNEVGQILYPEEVHPGRNRAVSFIRKHLAADASVLDLGCGYGEISKALAPEVKLVVGVDHDSRKIAVAQDLYQTDKVEFRCEDAERFLSDSGQVFDVLILSHVLEHIDNPEEFLTTYRRFFKFVYVEVPDFDATILNHFRKELGMTLSHTDNDHVNEFDRFELLDLFRQCELEVTDREYMFGIQRYWCRVS